MNNYSKPIINLQQLQEIRAIAAYFKNYFQHNFLLSKTFMTFVVMSTPKEIQTETLIKTIGGSLIISIPSEKHKNGVAFFQMSSENLLSALNNYVDSYFDKVADINHISL